jgi:nucleoid-associated protein YgaU
MCSSGNASLRCWSRALPLERASGDSYGRAMRRKWFGWIALAACLTALPARAQDAAVEERLNKLSAHIEDLLAAQAEQQKRIAALSREIESLREQINRPAANYATAEDLRKLAEKLQEIDQKRVADNEKIIKELERLARLGGGARSEPPREVKPAEPKPAPAPAGGTEKGYEYVIQSGDTLSGIVAACREKGIKVTVEQILKANPGLNERRLRPGQKIFIPAPNP